MSKSKKKTTIRKEVKKEVKAIKNATRHAPRARANLRHAAKAVRPGTVKGHGGYFGDLGSKIGNAVDSGVGLVKTITGMGEYKVKSNSVMESGRPPQVRNTRYSTTVLGEPEYICDIKGSQNFSIQSFPVNPGISRTHPWFAPQAKAYEQYKPKGILFEFRSTCGDAFASNNNAEGVVIMASEYNVHLPPFADKQEMEDHEYTTAIKPSMNGLHPIECARNKSLLGELYVRVGTELVPDLSLYDVCNFYIATQGQQTDGVTLGELWITYEYELLKPSLSSITTNNVFQHWYWDSKLGTQPTSSNAVGNLREMNTGTVTSPSATKIENLQPGKYFITLSILSSYNGVHASGVFTYTNGTQLLFCDTDPTTGIPSNNQLGSAAGYRLLHTEAVEFTAIGSFNCTLSITDPILTYDLYIVPFGEGLTRTSRRAVDWDPMALMQRRLDDMCDRLVRAEARHRALASPPWARSDDDEKELSRVLSSRDPEDRRAVSQYVTPPNSPVLVEQEDVEEHPLSRSEVLTATSLLDRLNLRLASKTGSHVRAA